MKAVILAGGKGTRLAPYTMAFPKPLVPIGQYPILEILLRQLSASGVSEAVLTVGYLGELIRAYFSQRPSLLSRLKLSYVSEEVPSGTAGSLAFVTGVEEPILVMNGDILTTLDFKLLLKQHKESQSLLTIATHRKSVQIDLGVLDVAADGQVIGYHEKPRLDYVVSMGIYVYDPRALTFIRRGEYLDFPDLVLRLIRAGERVGTYPSDDLWLDIGRHEDYERAAQVFEENRRLFCRGFSFDG